MKPNEHNQHNAQDTATFPTREIVAAVILVILVAFVLLSQPLAASAADAAAGDAAADAIPTQDLWSIISSGGPLMIPIGICSF